MLRLTGRKESVTTEWLNWTELKVFSCEVISKFSQITLQTYHSKAIISESKVLFCFRRLILEHPYLEIFNWMLYHSVWIATTRNKAFQITNKKTNPARKELRIQIFLLWTMKTQKKYSKLIMKVISGMLLRLFMWKIVRVSTLFHESRKTYFNFTWIIVFCILLLKLTF